MALFDEHFLKKLEYLNIVSRKLFAGRMRAERQTKKVGAGIEFADHRDYAPGDDYRYLDWNVYGRLDRLLVRLFHEEEELYIYLLLDCSRSMLTGAFSKFDQARRIVAALSYVGLANLDRVNIISFGDALREELPPRRGKGQIFTILDFLEKLETRGVTNLQESVRALVHGRRRRGLAVVASDFFDPRGYEDALKLLGYMGFGVYAVHLVAPEDRYPNLSGEVEMVDIELGSARLVTIDESALAGYKRAFENYIDGLEKFCLSRGFGYVRTPTEVEFQEVVLKIFRYGGFLR